MSSQPPPTTDLPSDDDFQDERFEMNFRPEFDDHELADNLLRGWNSDSDDDEDVEKPNSLYENLLQREWPENGMSGNRSVRPIFPALPPASPATISTGARSRDGLDLVLPGVNEIVFGFKLLQEIGKGTFARVFLAQQGILADREVVLKLSKAEGTEDQTLAQLQHTHVVPIYSVHQDTIMGIRAVCMPYFGGRSLDKVQAKLWDGRGIPVSGGTFIEALDAVADPEPKVRGAHHVDQSPHAAKSRQAIQQSTHTARNVLAGLTYVQAAAWIVGRLAEGLHHSHERNVIHRDIKPSNILISAEAQPLLLDFNVSQAIDCNKDDITLGGTIAYMSPEQLRAVIVRDTESLSRVTHQSDIYSLGLVLYEMLNCPRPYWETAAATIDPKNLTGMLELRERALPSLKANSSLEIPWSLESIVRKSLAPKPEQRYLNAAQMAEDLDRFLQDQPLKYAPELSRIEQVQKWTRRHPKLTSSIIVMSIALAFILPGAFILSATRDDLATKQNLLANSRAIDDAQSFQHRAKDALCLIKTVTPVEETLILGMTTCEHTLAIFGIQDHSDWQQGDSWRRLSKVDRMPVAEMAQELLIVLASAHVRKLPGNDEAVLTALSLLDKAEAIRDLPRSRALNLDRAKYFSLLKREADAEKMLAEAKEIPATSAHDMYMLASTHARQQDYREAINLLTKAIDLAPEHYWSYFERALCHLAQRESALAATDLGTCIGLWPESSWAYFNRGFALDLLSLKNESAHDYTKAIALSAKFISPYLNRGLIRLELRQPAEALKDFERVNQLGRKDIITDAARAMAFEGLGRHDEADALFAEILDAAQSLSDLTVQRIGWSYAFAIFGRKPDTSRQIFDNILKLDPKQPQALYGQGMVEMQRGKLEFAIRRFDEAINSDPKFIEPLRYRAVALARLGQLQAAWTDAYACLEKEPTNPDSRYIASCVTALAAKMTKPREQKEQLIAGALKLLREAISCGAKRERARTDPDFSALYNVPEFRKLVGEDPGFQPEPALSDEPDSI
jgi:serine/threonine protein kinase/Flp pilus assembly protein TadD